MLVVGSRRGSGDEGTGGVVDEQTVTRANATGIDLYACLGRHDVTPALKKLEDVIETGATGTNVNDLKFMLVHHGAQDI